jgi:myo-inositol-1(or 4)-monophosphatase
MLGDRPFVVKRAYGTLAASMQAPERRVAIEAALAAGELLRRELGGVRRIAYKGAPTNLVTEMDARAEALILDTLGRVFPDDAYLTEEAGSRAGRSGRRWIVDPLDATTNYAHGVPIYAVSIALEVVREVTLGVISDPSRRELFVAERGRGAWLGDQPLQVSTAEVLDESLLATGFPYDIRPTRATNLPEWAAFSRRARAVRRLGSAVLDLAWLAAGRFDGYWELTVGPWDVAAGSLLVEEAGGRVSDLTGGPLDLDAPAIVASNGRIHDAMLEVLREVRSGGEEARRLPPGHGQ